MASSVVRRFSAREDLVDRALSNAIRGILLLLPLLTAEAQHRARDADPFRLSDRFTYYLHRTYGWQRLAGLGFDAGFDFTVQGAPGFSELLRGYGDGFGRRIVSNSTEFALGAALHEDSRYRRLDRGNYATRLRYASVRAFQSARPGGGYRPAYSRFGALAAGELIAPLWSSQGICASDALLGVGFGILGQMENNYLDEFTPELKRFGRKVGRRLRRVVRR